MHSFIAGQQTEMLPPLAVIPSDAATGKDFASREEFANDSNSQMVYAQDEFGNNIAVGVFVTEAFCPNDVTAKDLDDKISNSGECIPQANINWVGALEECPTEVIDSVDIQNDLDVDNENCIHVYKVKKEGKLKGGKVQRSVGSRKTLRELKTKYDLKVARKGSKSKEKASNTVKIKLPSKSKRRRQRCFDKAYKGPSAVSCAKLQSKL